MTAFERYSSPLAERYASKAMLRLWSPQTRHGLWRRLWLALAEAEKELGVAIPDDAAKAIDYYGGRGPIQLYFEHGGRVYTTDFQLR